MKWKLQKWILHFLDFLFISSNFHRMSHGLVFTTYIHAHNDIQMDTMIHVNTQLINEIRNVFVKVKIWDNVVKYLGHIDD